MISHKAKRLKPPSNRCSFCQRVSTKLFVNLNLDFKRLGCASAAALCPPERKACRRCAKELDHLAVLEAWLNNHHGARSLEWFVTKMGLSRTTGVMWSIQADLRNKYAGFVGTKMSDSVRSLIVTSSAALATRYYKLG